MSNKSSFTLNDKDVIRVSSFMANANEVFRTSPFIKNFDYLDLFFYIYRNDTLLKKDVRFKDLSIYSSKSDVYLTKFLKHGVEATSRKGNCSFFIKLSLTIFVKITSAVGIKNFLDVSPSNFISN